MTTTSVRNPDLFQIIDNQTIFYGCDQEWYTTKWQRLSGCGPTTVSSIMHYLYHANSGSGTPPFPKSDCLLLMEEIWEYVTPTLRGIPSTKPLYKGAMAYAKAKALDMDFHFLDIPKNRRLRPEFPQLLSFVETALRSDTPVAFLNLNNGTETQLDSWHWVTIISLEYEEDGSNAIISILDEGVIKKINLAQWFQSTTLGGGFVSFHLR